MQDKNNQVQGPFNVDELERSHMIKIRQTGMTLPFGNENQAWNEFKNTMIPGDKIYFVTHHERPLPFQESDYVLVRDGCVFFSLLDSMS